MKRYLDNQLDNRGASLVMVMICFVFVAILGTIVLTAALNTVEMKKIDKNSKQSFYHAEAALDEIKVGLSETVAECLAKSYQLVLETYSSKTEAQRDTYFEEQFNTAMNNVFTDKSKLGTALNNYLKETKLNSTTGNGAFVSGNPVWVAKAGDSIVFQNVTVVFVKDGYQSSITTDITVLYPSVAIVSPVGSMEDRPYLNYSLIANNGLWSNTNNHMISGNLYAGIGGINISNEGNQLTLNHSLAVTAGDITVKDKAQFLVTGTDSEIWADNMITTQTNKTLTPSINTVINIIGNCYIKDDLVLSAYNSKVMLTGEYYGYSNGFQEDGTSTGDPRKNSAIMVNAANAAMDLSGLTQLKIAGRAFINMEKLNYDVDASYGAAANSNSNILTGESMTIKGTQAPYLVPYQYLKAGHNPVTWAEYKSFYDSATMTDGMVDTVKLLAGDIFVNDLVSDTQAKFSYYLNTANPVKKAFYKFGTDTNVVYYFLNFASEEKATIFYKNYNLCYHDSIYNGFSIGSVIVNSKVGSVMTSGNLITYDDDVQVMVGDTKKYVNNYASKYDNLIHTLQKNVTSTNSIYENIVNVINVEHDTNTVTKQVYQVDDTTGYINIINNDNKSIIDTDPSVADADAYVFDQSGKAGIIIATGDVVLKTSFSGMIISGGNVYLEGSANFTSAPAVVNELIMKHTDISKYINGLSASTAQQEDWNAIDISSLIVYKNWRKN